MKQTWANYYEYISQDKDERDVHQIMAEERERQLKLIKLAEEHLQGISLFYEQSPLEDPKITYVSQIEKHNETMNHKREISSESIL